jgi:hypothetical protein
MRKRTEWLQPCCCFRDTLCCRAMFRFAVVPTVKSPTGCILNPCPLIWALPKLVRPSRLTR